MTRLNQPRDNGKTAVIGSSIIKDISDAKLVNTSVTSISGGVIDRIKKTVSDIKDRHAHIYLVVGGNDCDNDDNPAQIIEKYKALIATTKSKATNVTVASVCPRVKEYMDISVKFSEKIESVNASLQILCQEQGVTFVNNTESFHLADGSINDGYLLWDGVHLTKAGTDRLAKNLGLSLRDGVSSVVHRQKTQKQVKQPPNTQQQPGYVNQDMAHSFWNHARQKAQDAQLLPTVTMATTTISLGLLLLRVIMTIV